jgi:hypothetical protein
MHGLEESIQNTFTAFFILMAVTQFAFPVAIMIATFWNGPVQRHRRWLARAPAVPAKDLVPGAVQKVTGVIEPIEALTSPIEGAACVFWDLTVRLGSGSWGRDLRRRVAAPFWLNDGTARVYVDLVGVVVNLERTYAPNAWFVPSDGERNALAVFGLKPSGWLRYTLFTARLDVGARVSVMGRVDIREVDGKACFMLVSDEKTGMLWLSDDRRAHG